MNRKIAEAKEKVRHYLLENGLRPVEIPKAILLHELIGLSILVLSWSVCYRFPPSQIPVMVGPINKMKEMVPARIRAAMSSSSMLTSKLGQSYIEASCCRKLVRPLTIPSKLYITFLLMKSGLFSSEEAEEDADIKTSSFASASSSSAHSQRKKKAFSRATSVKRINRSRQFGGDKTNDFAFFEEAAPSPSSSSSASSSSPFSFFPPLEDQDETHQHQQQQQQQKLKIPASDDFFDADEASHFICLPKNNPLYFSLI